MQLLIRTIIFCCSGIFAILMFAVNAQASEQAAEIDRRDKEILLDSSSPGRIFEGIGAVSAGASSRLLIDYPEPQRSQILDYLFKPKFGAGFQHLKVEVGCGENSTCGSEPSHAISKEELANPQARGYEFWLMSEARKRNSEIMLDCLPWGYPSWVGDRFSKNSAEWLTSFLDLARKRFGLELDFLSAGQNENGTDLRWIREDLRPTLDAHGFGKIKLQAPDDDSEYWQIFDDFDKDPAAASLISSVGYHYLAGREPWDIDQKTDRSSTEKAKASKQSLWASEEWSQSGASWDKTGALYLARLINKVHAVNQTSKFEIWCPVESIYNQIDWPDTGVMQADTPWSAHYTVWPAVWAVAHTTQFAKPGWKYIDSGCGQLDDDTWKGSFNALRDTKTNDWSLVVVSGREKNIVIKVARDLKQTPVHVWKSSAKEQFIELANLSPTNGVFKFKLDPDSIYTFSTTTDQHKGVKLDVPAEAAFPFPFKDDFEQTAIGEAPKFFSDQKGSFEVCLNPTKISSGEAISKEGVKGQHCLTQIVGEQGLLWYGNWLLKPHTLFGDSNWTDCTISADVKLSGGDVEIGGRYGERNKLGYRWILTRDGRWQLNWQYVSLGSGQIENFDPQKWHKLQLGLHGDSITGSIDDKPICTVQDKSNSHGMAFLASTYDHNYFDNLRVDK